MSTSSGHYSATPLSSIESSPAGGAVAGNIWTDQELLERSLPAIVARMGPIANGSLVLISAATGIGKTQLAIALTWHMANGREFLGLKPDEPSRVLHIDGEMPAKTLQDRRKMYGPIPDGQVGWICRESMLEGTGQINLADPGWQEDLLEFLRVDECDVLMLDNVYSLISVPGQTMSSDVFWQTVEPLNNRLRALNKTVIWFDHTNTEGRVFGTKTKEWQMDLTANLAQHGAREKGKTSFTLEWDKVRGDGLGIEYTAINVTMQQNDLTGMADWHWEPERTMDAKVEAIAEALQDGRTYREITAVLGVSPKTIAKVKKDLGIK